MPKPQSAYRKFHSTETAVTKVFNDMLLAADADQMSALCLLDLTLPSTPSTMSCYYSDWSDSLIYVASC